MSNPWASGRRSSVSPPSSCASGDKRILIPPDPPDSNLPLAQYPPLSPTIPTRREKALVNSTIVSPYPTGQQISAGLSETGIALCNVDVEMVLGPVSVADPITRSDATVGATVDFQIQPSTTVVPPTEFTNNLQEKFTVLLPKFSSPIQTNPALSPTPTIASTSGDEDLPHASIPHPNHPVPPGNSQPVPNPSLVEKIRKSEDKSLKRLAPVTISASGRPSVLIPDAVFQKGADMHKDFIVCVFNGRSPPFSQIQSVLNHLWGKGKRLEIHNNPSSHSLLVRITSDYLKQKILEKGYWYVGDSLFHTKQWTTTNKSLAPSFSSIQIWAHLTGIPLDLRHQEGLSLVAGLVGEPKETDDFTKNLVSLTLAHAKVEVDLTKPLPDVVEFTRQSGEIVEVLVSFPWLPPTCSHCKELGHVVRNCLLVPLPPKAPPANPSKNKTPTIPKTPSGINLHLKTPTKTPSKTPTKTLLKNHPSSSSSVPSPSLSLPEPCPVVPVGSNNSVASVTIHSGLPSTSKNLKPLSSSSLFVPPPFSFASIKNPSLDVPSPTYQPSLKRSRSDPSISPPNNLSLFSNSSRPPICPYTTNQFSLLSTLDSSGFMDEPNPSS